MNNILPEQKKQILEQVFFSSVLVNSIDGSFVCVKMKWLTYKTILIPKQYY